MKKKVIAVFTGNRAEYGLQFPILKAIKNHSDLDYKLIVSGAHLDRNFGETISEIENDGFEIHAEVKIDIEEDTLYATAQAIGTGILSMSQALDEIRPDMLVVYADRFEGFAAVIAGTQMNVPTAHIEGGDITEGGALDDSVRHAMTKLSHLHFTTNQQASNRLLAMGEEPWRVHTVGFPAIDLIKENNFAKPDEIVEKYRINLDKPVVLFTQHSVTTEFDQADEQLAPSLVVIERLAGEGVQVILTYPNNDAGGRRIIKKLEEFAAQDKPNIQLHRSLGRYFYHGVLSLSTQAGYQAVCVGNSSSGIKETPAFFCPTVNIGSRQQGRLRAENVIDADYDSDQIYNAIKRSLSPEFREICNNCSNPYGVGDAGIKIANCLAETELDLTKLLRKGMTLRGECNDEGWRK
ncbi:UDP-N-acetylglucosamine 2-epimerase [Litoricola sp.]|nr:UDP-N-acetylglucosamine 2-epimerase [Litorivicinus sp.]